jgi:FlaA1/EpsC-like NDP-sugar epimerase
MEENPAQAIHQCWNKNLADLRIQCGEVVMVSTDKAVNPSNVMGASKRIAEKYVQSLQLKSRKENNIKATKFITTVSKCLGF